MDQDTVNLGHVCAASLNRLACAKPSRSPQMHISMTQATVQGGSVTVDTPLMARHANLSACPKTRIWTGLATAGLATEISKYPRGSACSEIRREPRHLPSQNVHVGAILPSMPTYKREPQWKRNVKLSIPFAVLSRALKRHQRPKSNLYIRLQSRMSRHHQRQSSTARGTSRKSMARLQMALCAIHKRIVSVLSSTAPLVDKTADPFSTMQ